MAHWSTGSNTFKMLGHLKFSHMGAHLDVEILPHLSPYFAMLHPHIFNLWMALYPGQLLGRGREASHSCTTLRDIIKAFKVVLSDWHLIGEARKDKPVSLEKRSFPGELVISGNGWDAVKVQKKESKSKLKNTIHYKQSTSLMKKHGQWNSKSLSAYWCIHKLFCFSYIMYHVCHVYITLLGQAMLCSLCKFIVAETVYLIWGSLSNLPS